MVCFSYGHRKSTGIFINIEKEKDYGRINAGIKKNS